MQRDILTFCGALSFFVFLWCSTVFACDKAQLINLMRVADEYSFSAAMSGDPVEKCDDLTNAAGIMKQVYQMEADCSPEYAVQTLRTIRTINRMRSSACHDAQNTDDDDQEVE